MSKDSLDRTLEHDPDQGSDQVADRTLHRDQTRKPDRESPEKDDQTVEMRAEERVEVVVPVEMQVTIEVPGAGKISGATENMSCSGMLARLNGPVQMDSRCQVNFLGTDEVAPNQVFGRVIRVAKSRFGYSVAFRFERTVQLSVPPPRPKRRSKGNAG